ncbi:MAG: alpha/beta hydrolase [Pseudomonadota bacterium]
MTSDPTLTIDPHLFTDAAISPQTRAFNDDLERMLAPLPAAHEVPVHETRAARDAGRSIWPPAGPLEGSHFVEIPGAPGPGTLRVSPGQGGYDTVYLHIHGGGWTLGRPEHFDKHNQALAAATGVTVASVTYRLAPEHAWPLQREDCLAAAQWLLSPAAGDLRAKRLIVGGESAGAHLGASLALGLRNMQRGDAVAGLVLNYGVFDLTMTPSMANWGDRKLILSTPTVAWFIDNVDPGADQRQGDALSPLKAPLHDLPPALFQVGTADPLLDDTLMMASRWAGAGNRAELAVYPGGVHAFDAFDLEISRAFHARTAAFVKACL